MYLTSFETPILFLVFNRPENTRLVLEAIKRVRPSKLFVAADGPRSQYIEDKEKCEEVRKIIHREVDWSCQVETWFREENVGCGKAVGGAISWFFQHVEMGIILEDDCLPEASFFSYCEVLLKEYAREPKVLQISGTNHLLEDSAGRNGYYYSNVSSIWGWATWRRAWQLFSVPKELDPNVVTSKYTNSHYAGALVRMIEDTQTGKIDTWDTYWAYTFCLHDGLAIVPFRNQIRNIGVLGTHEKQGTSRFLNMPTFSMEVARLEKPEKMEVDVSVEQRAIRTIVKVDALKPSSWLAMVGKRIKACLSKIYSVALRTWRG